MHRTRDDSKLLPMSSIELRPLRSDEIPALCALINRIEHHDGVPRVLSLDELQEELDQPYLDLDADTRVAVEGDQLVGWTWVWNAPTEAILERAFVPGGVDPDHRSRGVGRALLAWSIDRATERMTGRTHGFPRFIRVGAYDWEEANHRLYARLGFTAVRWFDDLIRPLDDLPSAPIPVGIELREWPDDQDEELRRVRNEAFADHWGSAPLDVDTWHSVLRGHSARPDLSVIAVDTATGEIVGLSHNEVYPEDEELTGRREAWIGHLATARAYRGRGLASAMLARSMQNFTAAGFSHAMLDVDADNPTGAHRLYRALGFETLHRNITHQIELSER